MKISSTNLYLNFNKNSFLELQNNNNSINFGKNFYKKSRQISKEEVKNHYVTGKNIEDFCWEKGISIPTYYKILHSLKIGADELKRKRQDFLNTKQEKLTAKILENHQNGGKVRDFCIKYKINQGIYYHYLAKIKLKLKENNE